MAEEEEAEEEVVEAVVEAVVEEEEAKGGKARSGQLPLPLPAPPPARSPKVLFSSTGCWTKKINRQCPTISAVPPHFKQTTIM